MNIVFDISHPAHINFFKNAIGILKSENGILITVLDRGRLPQIAKKEFNGIPLKITGKHTGTKFSIYWDANIKKALNLYFFLLRKKIDIGVSVGGFVLGFNLKLKGVPNIQFDDDPESSKNFYLEKKTATELFMPAFNNSLDGVKTFNALKEWAYLSPKYFKPDETVLIKYGLKPYEYIFVREVSTGSLNYSDQNPDLILSIAEKLPGNIKYVLSLEKKKNLERYPSGWIKLEEPVDDIHSLIYYSKGVLSSGDSMAREGAILGVPGIYCGFREMNANKILMGKNKLIHSKIENVPNIIVNICNSEFNEHEQVNFRNELLNQWEDVTEFIIKQIKKYRNR